MKYMTEIEIDRRRTMVIELFDNPDNLKHWQPGFQSFEHLSGTRGQPGAKSKLVFLNRGRTMEMIETITVRNLPHEFSGTYDIKGIYNEVRNYFTEVAADKTKWVSHIEFRFSGIGMKILVALFPGMFKKQSQKFMQLFKEFAEKQ